MSDEKNVIARLEELADIEGKSYLPVQSFVRNADEAGVDMTDLDWRPNNRRIEIKIRRLSDREVRSHLLSLVIGMNCVATNYDGGQEMTIESHMTAARTLLHDLGYPLVDEVE